MPPGCSISVTSRCSGVISACVLSPARLCAATMASWAFSVSLFVFMTFDPVLSLLLAVLSVASLLSLSCASAA